MMHNPIVDGTIFRANWIRYKPMPALRKYDMLVCYTDPSFKSTTANDYKASRLWGKIGNELHLIDCYVRQDTVGGMVRWLYDLYERTRDKVAILFFMEANFMQDVILDEFAVEGNLRGYQLPIMPDKRKKPEKIQRIEAVSPLWERGFVFYDKTDKRHHFRLEIQACSPGSQEAVGFVRNEVLCAQYGWQAQGSTQAEYTPPRAYPSFS